MNPLKRRHKFEESMKEQLDGLEIKPSENLWGRIESELQGDSFESLLREKLDDYPAEPSAKVWEQLEESLPRDNRRRRVLYLTLLVFVSAIAWLGGYMFRPAEQPIAQKEEKAAKAEMPVSTPAVSHEVKRAQSRFHLRKPALAASAVSESKKQ